MNKFQKITGVIFLLSLISIFLLARKFEKDFYNEIEANKAYTVCKVYKVDQSRGRYFVYYYFYYKDNIYKGNKKVSYKVEEFKDNFFSVKFSTRNPNLSIVSLKGYITDVELIKKAGFSIAEVSSAESMDPFQIK